ncbi:Crp/Fnr family transcriptional regulator [Paenibacillus puldeungensis]|uniref:Crp/Fnr family transcriptional regulator n=1 Tax=Paenibacillus puldeungensis TaxID=696536 RepID=A0ABW3S0B1_9BACL
MKEIEDRELLASYLHSHQLDRVFGEALRPHLALYSYDQGEAICTQGEPSEIMYVLVKGKVKVFTTSPEGKTLVVCFKTALEVVGDIEYVQGTDIINTVEAVSPTHMIGIHYRWLNKYNSDHAPFLQFLLKIITQKFYLKSSSMSFNMLYPVEVRLASYLLAVFFDETDPLFWGRLRTSDLTDVANLIGTSYRHLNRVILKFCSQGLIERTKDGIIVKNRQGLQNLALRNIYE